MRYVVIGNPVAHSRSPQIHSAFAAQFGLADFQYERLLLPVDGFTEGLCRFVADGGGGCNVTLPFKEEAWRCCDRLSERARAAQAVNTIRVEPNGKLYGDNTDGAGLVADLLRHVSLAGKRILLLGAGGAARGVILPLAAEKPAEIVIANRTAAKAQELAQAFSGQAGVPLSGMDFDAVSGAFDVVVNATSASIGGNALPLPAGVFAPGALAYDMYYSADETAFLQQARESGAAIRLDGLGMLVGQAAEAFFLWTGFRPEVAPVLAELRTSLQGGTK
ncbi:shikimate dehydrogenase [Formivibrio citricus]|uniref:Shikimate dehydrogenase (NADP(+)) n=2 Tax=Formivibrio citricus TaxID=83765 RepID=A0A1I4XUI1_9NEIS|nr:shikimate dehydrogenase [Formivibrio citricus]